MHCISFAVAILYAFLQLYMRWLKVIYFRSNSRDNNAEQLNNKNLDKQSNVQEVDDENMYMECDVLYVQDLNDENLDKDYISEKFNKAIFIGFILTIFVSFHLNVYPL